jgi:hypothetical protein
MNVAPRSSSLRGPSTTNTDEKYLPSRAVRDRYGRCSLTLHRWVRDPKLGFPQPKKWNGRLYWREADLIEWERSPAGKTSAESCARGC